MDLIYHNGNPDITLSQIYTFIVVAEYGNFTKASAELHISQPSISKIISKFEEITGLSLFQRNPRGAVLTESGRILYNEWKSALQMLQSGYEKASLSASLQNSITLGLSNAYTGSGKITPTLDEFISDNPDVDLHASFADSQELRRGIAGKNYDAIFVPSFEADSFKDPAFESKLLKPAPIELTISKKMPISNSEVFSKQLLEHTRLISLSEKILPDYDAYVRRLCQEHHIAYESVLYAESLQDAYIALLKGKGFFFLSSVWFPGFSSDQFYHYQLSAEKGSILMVWKQSNNNPALNALKKCIHY